MGLRNRVPYLFRVSDVQSKRKTAFPKRSRKTSDISRFARGSGDLVAAHQRGFGPDAAKTVRGPGNAPGLHFSTSIAASFSAQVLARAHGNEPGGLISIR